MKLLVSTVPPYEWLRLDRHNKAVDKGAFLEAAFLNTIPRDIKSVIGVAPAESTTCHTVEVPAKKRSNMFAAIPYALEESLSEEIEDLHFTVVDWVHEGPAQVVVAARRDIQGWLDLFESAGVKLDAIIPEYALLPIHSDCDSTLVRQSQDRYLLKTSRHAAVVLDQEAFDYWWSDPENHRRKLAVNDKALAAALREQGGENVSHWSLGADFRSWLEHAPGQFKSAPNLLHDRFEPEHLKPNTAWINVAAVLSLVALAAFAASQWFEAGKLERQYAANQAEIRALFEEAFPGQEYLDSPRRQITSLLSLSEEQPADETFQYLLGVASQHTPNHQAVMDEINYREHQLQIGVSVPNFATLEKLTAEMDAEEGVKAALISSGSRDKRVTGQIKIVQEG